MRVVKERANAKINLFLDVIARREDGFHDVKTVMHSVSLYDEITVTYKPRGTTNVRISVGGCRWLPTDENNLAVRAAKLFLECSGGSGEVEIILDKNIPISAGLAGGSSDAAAVMRAMNRIFNNFFTVKALFKMCESLGSDVPYCLIGKTALCEGRGEIITRLADTLKLNMVIAIADEHVSTPMAYSKLDKIYSDFDGSVRTGGEEKYRNLLKSLSDGTISQDALFNVFEAAVLPECPKAEMIKREMISLGADATLMSGSGPSVYGIFKSAEEAITAEGKLKEMGLRAYFVTTV